VRYLTKDQSRAPKRDTMHLSLPEYSAPLLLAKPSASLAIRLRESKSTFHSAEAITAMIADMLVTEDGARLFTPEEVPAFLEGISADSLTRIVTTCSEMYVGKGGDPGNSKPSTSAA
jgi:hypothetical protein